MSPVTTGKDTHIDHHIVFFLKSDADDVCYFKMKIGALYFSIKTINRDNA